LNDISIIIKKHEKIGIIGRTGAGKSTFIKMILKFTDYYQGSIKIEG